MRRLLFLLIISTFFLTACSSNKIQVTDEINTDSINNTVTEEKNNNDVEKNNENNISDNSFNKDNKEKDTVVEIEDVSNKIKDYIIKGQDDKSEAQKLKWSESFLNEVNIEKLYQQYINNGGEKNNIEGFALYITENAPILDNWEELFKKDLFNKYGEEVVRLEALEGDLYQAYVKKEGKEVPYVVVSSRTGYFHG